uniref:Hexosyltransferase n=1 Tax=Scylla olivacea TaxID=85551 RepID=A0A0P4WBL1_SCYOL
MASFPNFKWTVVPQGVASGPQGFSRGKGLHVAAMKVTKKKSDIIFFCDVDVLMKLDFLTRCRANVLYGRQVYYPMVFSLYNPKLVYPLQDQKVPPIPEQLKVTEETGFWREFGFGMSCVARGDYEAAGGFLDIRAWGGEDEALYQQFLMKGYIKVSGYRKPCGCLCMKER